MVFFADSVFLFLLKSKKINIGVDERSEETTLYSGRIQVAAVDSKSFRRENPNIFNDELKLKLLVVLQSQFSQNSSIFFDFQNSNLCSRLKFEKFQTL